MARYDGNDAIEPLAPDEALEMYLEARSDEVSPNTIRSHESRLQFFLTWCEQNNIGNLNDLTGRHCYEYRIWRRDEGGLNKVSLKTQLSTLRAFLKWCEAVDAVPTDFHRKIQLPTLRKGDHARDIRVTPEEAEQILDYLSTYEYASFEHVLFALLWETGVRTGSAHSLDTDDFLPDDDALQLEHRPAKGTTLKNGEAGNRFVALSSELTETIENHLDITHRDAVDDDGREALLTAPEGSGRVHKTNMRRTIYKVTRPCYYTNECPHDRDIDSCEATDWDKVSKCPSSVALHAIRRGSITEQLKEDVPKHIVSDRCNVAPSVIDEHYDVRDEKTKMDQRRDMLDLG